MPLTTPPPDPLAALLHAAMVGCRYNDDLDQYELDPDRCIDHATDARILRSRGVTLTPVTDPILPFATIADDAPIPMNEQRALDGDR